MWKYRYAEGPISHLDLKSLFSRLTPCVLSYLLLYSRGEGRTHLTCVIVHTINRSSSGWRKWPVKGVNAPQVNEWPVLTDCRWLCCLTLSQVNDLEGVKELSPGTCHKSMHFNPFHPYTAFAKCDVASTGWLHLSFLSHLKTSFHFVCKHSVFI